jgi:hypothetical protein
MPIKHQQIAGAVDTADIQKIGVGGAAIPIARVVSHQPSSDDIIIWDRAPIGWYGILYPNSDGTFPDEVPVSFANLAATTVITPPKRDIVAVFSPTEADWENSPGGAPAAWSQMYDVGYKCFVITKGNWGTLQAWDPTFNQPTAGTVTPITVNGVTYECWLTNTVLSDSTTLVGLRFTEN